MAHSKKLQSQSIFIRPIYTHTVVNKIEKYKFKNNVCTQKCIY